jgi:hypothetical protein
VSDPAQRRAFVSEFLTFDQAAQIVGRPASEVRYLVSERTVRTARRLRQVRGLQPRDVLAVTPDQLREGQAPELQPWQQFQLVNEDGAWLDEYGDPISA